MAKLGTLDWAERTGGKLAWFDRLGLIAQGVHARAAARRSERGGESVRHIEVDEVLPPDSAITREATALCQDASPPALFHHCLRAYFWARLLDDRNRPFDDEALFTAFLLHDLGLTARYRRLGDGEECFTLSGARLAIDLARRHGWRDDRGRLAAEAITLHLNVTVGDAHGREAQLVRIGSGGDAAGLGLHALHADQVNAVVARHPRLGFKQAFLDLLRTEATERPHCRVAFLQTRLGFRTLVRNANFAD